MSNHSSRTPGTNLWPYKKNQSYVLQTTISSVYINPGDRWGLDSGLVVVLFITAVYVFLVFGLFFYVKNEWCYVLFKNYTVRWLGES